jgi:cysteine desulfuration protein SufE
MVGGASGYGRGPLRVREDTVTLPERLANVVNDFLAAPPELRTELLLEHAERLPELPPELTGEEGRDRFEKVEECQTPFFLATDVADGRVSLHFDCPPQAPTTRGFAGILHTGLDGASAAEILAVPADFHHGMGLAEVISPLRMRGMDAILFRLKRQVAARSALEG